MKTPQEVADATYRTLSNLPQKLSGGRLREIMAAAIEADRAQLREHITTAIHDAALPRDDRNLERRAILTRAALEGWGTGSTAPTRPAVAGEVLEYWGVSGPLTDGHVWNYGRQREGAERAMHPGQIDRLHRRVITRGAWEEVTP